MTIKFKLLRESSGEGNFSELQVVECTYDDQTIDKIVLTLSPESKSIIEGGVDRLFIIKNIQNNEIEPNGNILKINSLNPIITPVKIDFLFAAKQVRQINNNSWEIELEFIHFWNGERIQKIHILNADNWYRRIIEENKNKYLFQLTKVGRYNITSSFDQISKVFTIYENDFQELNNSFPWQINLEEVPVKNLRVLNNAYLFEAGEVLARQGLRNYEKIELVTNQRINEGEIISFTVPDLRIFLQKDEEDKVLRIGQNYHSLTKIQPEPEISADDLIEEEIQKFLVKYRNVYQKETKSRKEVLQKFSVLLNKTHSQSKTSSSPVVELIKQQNNLFHKLEVFSNQTKFQKKIAILKEKHRNSDQIDQLQQELKKIDREFLEIGKKVEESIFLAEEYLGGNWPLLLQNDPKFQQLLTGYKLSQSEVLDGLSWLDFFFYLQKDGELDYFNFEEFIQKKKASLNDLNDLGYKPAEMASGEKYEEWNKNKVKKNEAAKAINIDYLPEQWNDPQYEEYKEVNRVLADGMITTFRRKWVPPLTNAQKKRIKGASASHLLVEIIMETQEQRYLLQVKNYFKDIIEQELKEDPKMELDELDLTTYKRRINNSGVREQLRLYVKKSMMEIKKIRSNKIVSVEKLRERVKKNISKILTKSKLKTSELHSQYQNWLTDIEKIKNKSEILQFEQDLILLLEEINFFLQQKWFPNLNSEEKNQIKQVKDEKELEEQIKSLLERKRVWLTIWQINSRLQRYRELRNENDQNYFLQKRQLFEIKLLLVGISSPFLSEEQKELGQKLSNVLIRLDYLFQIKSYQQKFNELPKTSLKEKEETLQLLQKLFQEWSEEGGRLSEDESASRIEVEVKLGLIEQGKSVGNLSVLNKRQSDFNLLNLPPETSEENEVQTGNDYNFFSPQNLALLTFGSLILILFWRWYRKKREEDPFW